MKFKYDDEIFDFEGDALIHCLVENSDEEAGGLSTCRICGETMADGDLEMHLAYGHGLVEQVPETEAERAMLKRISEIPDNITEEERIKLFWEAVNDSR